jgi:hypothetical protein
MVQWTAQRHVVIGQQGRGCMQLAQLQASSNATSAHSGGHSRRQVHPVSHSTGGHNAREKCVRTSSDEEDEDPELELSSRGITAD